MKPFRVPRFQITDSLKRLMPWVFAGVMAAAAAAFHLQFINQRLEQGRRALKAEEQRLQELMANYPEPVAVVVASKDVRPGETLGPSDLTSAQVPPAFIQPYATQNPNDLVGLITLAPIAQNEQIMLNKLRRPDQVPLGSTLSGLTPKGKRAVTIDVDPLSGLFLRPGDTVDILWSLRLPVGGSDQPVTLTLFQDVPILAVGQELLGRAPQQGQGGSANTVTLAMTPQETAFLLFAKQQGQVQLTLRPGAEKGSQASVAPATIGTLMQAQLGLQTAEPPPPPPKTTREVEVYRGLNRNVVVVSEQP